MCCFFFFLLEDPGCCAYPVRGDGQTADREGAAQDWTSSRNGAGSLAVLHGAHQQKLSRSEELKRSGGLWKESCCVRNTQGGPPARKTGGRARSGTARLGARSVPGCCGRGAAPGALHRGLCSVSTPQRSYIWACSCGGQLWFSDNAVVSVEDAHFQSQPCICFSCGRSF